MVSIAGCLVFSAQPALTYLRGKREGGRGKGEEGGVRVERERREGSRGTVGAGDLLNDSQNVSKFLQLQFWLQEHQSHEPIKEQDSKLRNLISSHD